METQPLLLPSSLVSVTSLVKATAGWVTPSEEAILGSSMEGLGFGAEPSTEELPLQEVSSISVGGTETLVLLVERVAIAKNDNEKGGPSTLQYGVVHYGMPKLLLDLRYALHPTAMCSMTKIKSYD